MGNTRLTSALGARVAELGEKVLAQELRCVEVLRRADEALCRAQVALEHSRRRLEKASAIRVRGGSQSGDYSDHHRGE